MTGQWFFWLLVAAIIYTYAGYTLVLALWRLLLPKKPQQKQYPATAELPEITLFIAAYNEKESVAEKIADTRQLNYPKNKLKQVWVTDGSDDGTPDILAGYPDIAVYHQPERRGKIGAMNRGMAFVQSPLVVFCDANTFLGPDSLLEIARLFQDERVGCVAGEKRIFQTPRGNAVSSGEGLYWRYESVIKRWESDIHSVVGAAGELFALRTHLFEPIARDTLLDDFVLSMRIALKGYRVKYSPQAYAVEAASASVGDELIRKVRIAAGGFQTLFRMGSLLNIFRHPFLSFAYFSHKVMRWLIVPLALPLLVLTNAWLAWQEPQPWLYTILLALQGLFYALVVAGWLTAQKRVSHQWLFAPYYLVLMNAAMWAGLVRYLRGQSNVNWKKARRAARE